MRIPFHNMTLRMSSYGKKTKKDPKIQMFKQKEKDGILMNKKFTWILWLKIHTFFLMKEPEEAKGYLTNYPKCLTAIVRLSNAEPIIKKWSRDTAASRISFITCWILHKMELLKKHQGRWKEILEIRLLKF